MAKLNYLLNRRAYENEINREGSKFHSKRLDAVFSEIDAYIQSPSTKKLDSVEKALTTWEASDATEFKNRGLRLKTAMAGEIQLARVQLQSASGKVSIAVIDPNDHPIYEPDLWNNGSIKTSTNCYAYACNSRKGHIPGEKPRPGAYAATGTWKADDPSDFGDAKPHRTAPVLRLAILRDGQEQGIDKRLIPLIRQPGEGVANIPGHYLIALVIAPGHQTPQYVNEEYIRDYHWYRQDRDGMWSHKPGHRDATNLDGSGNPIYDPRVCNMELSYFSSDGTLNHVIYEFVMFFYCPKGGVVVGERKQKKQK
jgi:hypothetical protein